MITTADTLRSGAQLVTTMSVAR